MADTPPNPLVSGKALSEEQKTDLMHRLARIEGQLRGVQKLIAKAAEPEDCESIAQQMSAARKALDRSFLTLLTHSALTHAENATTIEDAVTSTRKLAVLLEKFA